MPYFRDKGSIKKGGQSSVDNSIEDVPTRRLNKKSSASEADQNATVRVDQAQEVNQSISAGEDDLTRPLISSRDGDDDLPTEHVGQFANNQLQGNVMSNSNQPPQKTDRSDKTVLLGRSKRSTTSNKKSVQSSEVNQSTYMDDPVVGWLAIIAGPGQGMSVPIGYGMNSIGRNSDQRISLDYGDDEISRSTHASVTYDPKHRKFYLQHGGGTNLTYIDDAPVLTPAELEPQKDIQIGQTTLRFIPLCNDKFDWQDIEET